MNARFEELAIAAQKHAAVILNVGDFVSATFNGANFVNCYVYAIDQNAGRISFLWNGVVFSTDLELANLTTGLIRKFDRAAIIAEIQAMLV